MRGDTFPREEEAAPIRRTVSCPGRICLAGEDLDWIGGSSLLCAVNLRLQVTTELRESHLGGTVIVRSSAYPGAALEINLEELGRYEGHPLDYVHASIAVLARRKNVALRPLMVHLDSAVPQSAGLASSAAVTIGSLSALSEILGVHLTRDELCDLAYEVEAGELKTGAGRMDFYACALGGPMHVDCSDDPPRVDRALRMPPETRIVVVDTRTRRSTKLAIAEKRARWNMHEPGIVRYAELTSAAVGDLLRMLITDKPADPAHVGEVVYRCHRYLADHLRVSTGLIEECVAACLRGGAYGAKLTGTGKGGCLFALASDDALPGIADELKALPVSVHTTNVDTVGILLMEERSSMEVT